MSVQVLINKAMGRIGNVHPVIKQGAEEIIRRAYKQGLYVLFSDGYRSCADQDKLYAQGRTKPGKIVTNARCNQSLHNFGLALDMFITNKSGSTASWPVVKLRQAANIAKGLGFTWGGDWTSFKDYPHIQMTGGLSIAQLRAGIKPNISIGKIVSGNVSIKQLQKDLKKLGYNPGTIDGFDGPETQKAVKRFQQAEGLKIDGIPGKVTLAEIKRILNGGLTLSEATKINARLDRIEKSLNNKANKPSDKQTPDEDHAKFFEIAKEIGLLNGDSPYKPMSRQQFATAIVRKFFPDVKPEAYAETPLAWAQQNDISDGSNPAHPMTRQQGITIAYNAVNYTLDQVEEMLKEKEQHN